MHSLHERVFRIVLPAIAGLGESSGLDVAVGFRA